MLYYTYVFTVCLSHKLMHRRWLRAYFQRIPRWFIFETLPHFKWLFPFALRPFRRHESMSPLRSTLIPPISSSTDHDQLPRRIFCETKTGLSPVISIFASSFFFLLLSVVNARVWRMPGNVGAKSIVASSPDRVQIPVMSRRDVQLDHRVQFAITGEFF